MESIYWVITWLCHRECRHCYDDRFRPYHGADQDRAVAESRAGFAPVIANLPPRMRYLDRRDGKEKPGRVILAGGEVLLEPIRRPVLVPVLRMLDERYRDRGGVKLIVQTTGDVMTEAILDELLEEPVWLISVSGMDEWHDGLEEEGSRRRLEEKLTGWFGARGMKPGQPDAPVNGRCYHFFGATPGSWIGKLWPRGRARTNELSTADLEENFCNRWSGGLGFLETRYEGSEVSIDPEGNVYPCCLKTRAPIGNLRREPLETILERAARSPVYQAISAGQPQRMGLEHGWSEEQFLRQSETRLQSGGVYRNLCIGCDQFHEQVLMRELVQIGR